MSACPASRPAPDARPAPRRRAPLHAHRRGALARLALLALLVPTACGALDTRGVAPEPARDVVRDGLLVTHLDRARNRVLVELPPPGPDGLCVELLAVAALSRGLGSNDVGLDRGLLGSEQILRIRRLGEQVRFELPNTRYVVSSDEPAARRAAEESFAGSVIWGGEVERVEPDGRALLDLTPWLLTDLVGAGRRLAATGQGRFSLESSLSAVELDDCLAFPRNLELEATLGFRGERAGDEVAATAPDGRHPALRQHVTLMALPEPGFTPRPHDPRTGAFALERTRLDAPLHAPTTERLAVRHRLARDAEGRVQPIVYHLDRGAPEPVRTALLEGARWWSAAFAAAGWPGAFRVELLPEEVHPLDSRYHVIQWVHRRTRGWSYGRSVVDPRTGEILKAHVTLGALRVRQDVLLFEGLLGTSGSGSGAADDPVQLALARLRQLSAHEVGHTLGLAHNFSASTYDDRASVMDYPVPRVTLADDGGFELGAAYGEGVGSWDRVALRDLYGEPSGDETLAAARGRWLTVARAAGHLFLSDADARPDGAADPRAALWDDGGDAAEHLRHALAVRARALQRFDLDRVAPERPLAHLQEVLVPVALHHRYALDRAVKAVGGRLAEHRLAGELAAAGAPRPVRDVPAAEQRAALDAVLAVLDPAVLRLPEHVRALLAPRPPEESPHRELFPTGAAPHADPLSIAALIADQAVSGLLVPERLERVAEQQARDPAQLALADVLGGLRRAALHDLWASADAPTTRALRRVLLERVVHGLVELVDAPGASRFVRAQAEAELEALAERLASFGLGAGADDDAELRAHLAHSHAVARDIRRELVRPRTERPAPPDAPDPPPGSPIGAGRASHARAATDASAARDGCAAPPWR